MVGLANLIEGAAYSYLGDAQAAIESYRGCLKRRSPNNDAYDQHVSAFALYELGTALCSVNVSKEHSVDFSSVSKANEENSRFVSERRGGENGPFESSEPIQGLRLREPSERTNTHQLAEFQLTTNENRTVAPSLAAEHADGV